MNIIVSFLEPSIKNTQINTNIMCVIILIPLNNLICNKIPIFTAHKQKLYSKDSILTVFKYHTDKQKKGLAVVSVFQTELIPLSNVFS